jgi:polar amino acid transport system ATP-binding protein
LCLVRGIPKAAALATAEGAAADLELDPTLQKRYPEELSGGEAQRVQLLRAMVLQPDILLLDEVTANIDPETTTSVVEALWVLRQRAGRMQTIVIVTHIIDFAERFSDTIAFMSDGVIRETGPAASFRMDAQDKAAREFLSTTARAG